jgi:polysaccharide biosynthesis transport protein
MELRDYLAAIRRRAYVFIPIFVGIVGAHLLWVFYLQKQTYETIAHIAVQGAAIQRDQMGSVSPTAWVRTPTPTAVKAALEDKSVMAGMADLLTGAREFTLREFTHPPLAEDLAGSLAEFRENYSTKDVLNCIPTLLTVTVEEPAGVVHLTARATSRGSALAVSWAAAETVVQHFRERLHEDLGYLQDMLRDESEKLHKELTLAEEKWAKVVEDVGFDPISRQSRLEKEIEQFQTDADNLSAEQRELARKYRELVQGRPLVEGAPASVEAEKVLATNERVTALEKRIVSLKLQRDEQLERRTTNHPDVVDIEQRIQALEERLPEIIKEELANSLVRVSDREINEILYKSRKVGLDRELKQEQIAALKRKTQEIGSKALVLYPIRKTADDCREKYRTVLAMANNVTFVGATNLFGQVRILDPGRAAYSVPVRGHGTGPVVLTMLLALIAALGAVYFLEYVDMRVKNEHDVTRYLNLPLLGVMPRVDRKELTQISADGSGVAERFNTAGTLLRTTARELDLHTFAVCSAVAQEGKTTVSVNLAAALARKGARVVLVDADMRMPQVHRILGLANDLGLSTLLSGLLSPRQVIEGIVGGESQEGRSIIAEALQDTTVPGLRVLVSGPPIQAAAKLLESDRLPQVIRQLTDVSDFVIFDTPPIDRVGDALTVASLVDGCIFVVGSGKCEHHDVTWAKHLLTNVQANLLGAFLNQYSYRRARESDYYHYGRRHHAKVSA